MCGICGKLNVDPEEPVDAMLLGRMLRTLHHRGPDGTGEYRSGPVGLGHRRLSIIDLDMGAQPMSNEDGTVWVVYNGEIYNFQELRKELVAKGHVFKSHSDTEVIVHLYEELGESCVGRLRGMFAFALWDERTQTLLLARDRLGIKPLYYVNTGKSFLFASEIKALLADASVSRELNVQAIDRFVTYYYVPGNETLFRHIRKLEPGHLMTVRGSDIRIKQYWDLSFAPQVPKPSFEDAVEQLRDVLRRSVKEHLISDVPVGVLASGGVDSTGILRYAAEQSSRPLQTFTVGFADAGVADERPYARIAANEYGTIHHEMTMTASDFRDFLPRYVWHAEEPVCEAPAIALYYVTRLARDSSVKVLLSGEGGDEAFGGYQNYSDVLWLEGLKSKLGPAKGILKAAFGALDAAGWVHGARYHGWAASAPSEYYFSRTGHPGTLFNQRKTALYKADFVDALEGSMSEAPSRKLFYKVKSESLLHQMLYVDTKTWLPDDLLVKADKMTMAASVELRVPLLDHQVLEFAASLPEEYKVCGNERKRVLKAALADSVPRELLQRKKAGFPVPYARWLRRDLRDYVADTIQQNDAALGEYFSRDQIRSLVDLHARTGRGTKEVFGLLVLELWLRAFATGCNSEKLGASG